MPPARLRHPHLLLLLLLACQVSSAATPLRPACAPTAPPC